MKRSWIYGQCFEQNIKYRKITISQTAAAEIRHSYGKHVRRIYSCFARFSVVWVSLGLEARGRDACNTLDCRKLHFPCKCQMELSGWTRFEMCAFKILVYTDINLSVYTLSRIDEREYFSVILSFAFARKEWFVFENAFSLMHNLEDSRQYWSSFSNLKCFQV